MIIRGVELVGEDTPVREIVVSGRSIARVDRVSAHPSPDGPLLDLREGIAFSGLVNSHDHLEFNVYPALGHKHYADYVEWSHDIQQRDRDVISLLKRVPRLYRMRWGALKNLLCGVTTVAHHGDARDDLRGLPIEAALGTSIHSIRFARRWRWTLNAPFDRSPYVFHIGEGTSRESREEIDQLLRWNLFARPLIAVHAISMSPEQAANFRAVVWCPVSNEFLYGATADVASLMRSTAILFGTDSTLTAEWNFWNHLRRARTLSAMNDRQLFEAVTRTAATVWKRANRGRIAPGQIADLVVARKKSQNRWDAFFAVNPEDILLVLRAGVVVLSDTCLGELPRTGPSSLVRLGATEKRVAEDVPGILAALRECGVEPNLPIAAGSSSASS